jgi:hypothetical protein
MTEGRKAPATPDAARLQQLQAKLQREGRLSPEESAELMDGEFRRQRHDHDERLAQRRRIRRSQRPQPLPSPAGAPVSLDVTYAVLRAERERLVAELEFLRQQVRAAEQAQAEMRRLMLAVTMPKPREHEGPQLDRAAARPGGEAAASRRGLWQRIRGAESSH